MFFEIDEALNSKYLEKYGERIPYGFLSGIKLMKKAETEARRALAGLRDPLGASEFCAYVPIGRES